MADELDNDYEPTVCGRCMGVGWVSVGEGWVASMLAKQPNRPGYEAALRNTVYPCKQCHPGAFYRWANGCLDADHDAWGCERCQADADAAQLRSTRRRGRRRQLTAAGHPGGGTDD